MARRGVSSLSERPVADREGFEPSRRVTPSNGLASRRLQPLGHLSPAREEADFLAFPWGGRKPKVSVADNLSCPAAGGSVPPSRPALTAQAFRDVEADRVDAAGLDLRRDRLPEIGQRPPEEHATKLLSPML